MTDGIDHINIYSKGTTSLGRSLSNFTYSPIATPEGDFDSIEGYWYYLNSTHPDRDKLKKASGFEAKRLGRELKASDWNTSPEFKLKIITALANKLLSHPNILRDFLDNDLPFRHYYVYGGKIVEPKEGKWIVEFFEYLRVALIN